MLFIYILLLLLVLFIYLFHRKGQREINFQIHRTACIACLIDHTKSSVTVTSKLKIQQVASKFECLNAKIAISSTIR